MKATDFVFPGYVKSQNENGEFVQAHGLNAIDYIAIEAMKALLSSVDYLAISEGDFNDIALKSYQIAESMIEESNRD